MYIYIYDVVIAGCSIAGLALAAHKDVQYQLPSDMPTYDDCFEASICQDDQRTESPDHSLRRLVVSLRNEPAVLQGLHLCLPQTRRDADEILFVIALPHIV